ncbi:DUF4181 domain-containing protein [Saccharibacillus sp. JS10]|uniref:DUF4181 domain-containing protein n=1 Tax=Saccharibacillus sp. JS10 TaxID=2950552 RepID=UPI00210E5AAA|nr:DUF4181 domain-containing protein [Saccharibacillus sp. JS10]MCQ4086634.1 DUF4181 domain-containing protein [Saccharibacillus sp. JS10]
MLVISPIVAGLAVLQWVLDRIILENKDKMWDIDGDGFKPYVWFIVISSVLGVGFLIFLSAPYGYVWIAGLVTALFAVRATFERIYIFDSKRYIVSYWMTGIMLASTVFLALGIYG